MLSTMKVDFGLLLERLEAPMIGKGDKLKVRRFYTVQPYTLGPRREDTLTNRLSLSRPQLPL